MVTVLTSLDGNENRSHAHRGNQPAGTGYAVVLLDCRDRAHHKIGAGNQGEGIDQGRLAVR